MQALKVESFEKIPGISHAFFTRNGGVSKGDYASLNCSTSTGDEPELVEENCRRIRQYMGLDYIASVHQCHTPDVVIVGDDWENGHRPKADALVTRRAGIGLGIMGADCAPVLFVDPDAKIIAAAHAGWRGALAGVLENTLSVMVSLGASKSRIWAAIGPCIEQKSYEVGDDVRQKFISLEKQYDIYFSDSTRDGRFQFDLPEFIRNSLFNQKINCIERCLYDTYDNGFLFFSHRRSQLAGGLQCGRMLSVIVMDR